MPAKHANYWKTLLAGTLGAAAQSAIAVACGTPTPILPRGTRIRVGSTGTLEEILRGPARLDDGTHNLWGALRTSMATLGAANLKEMHQVEICIAPSLLTEGKVYQKAQSLGMGK